MRTRALQPSNGASVTSTPARPARVMDGSGSENGTLGIPRAKREISLGQYQTNIPSETPPGTIIPGGDPKVAEFLNRERAGGTFSGSSATRDFLRVNVIRNTDLQLVDVVGATVFDRSLGVHTIPLQGLTGSSAPSKDGQFPITDGKVLIVTKFQPWATVPNVGMPNQNVEIDPASLIGQVTFSLVAQGAGQPLNQTFVTPNTGMVSGTPFLFPFSVGEYPPVHSATIRTGSVSAIYNVINSPFPGWPRVVGVRMKAYLIDVELFDAVMNTTTKGTINKVVRETE